MDEGFKQSEQMLNELEAKIHSEYAKAAKEIEDKTNAYFSRFEEKDAEKRKQYEEGKITKEQYTTWRQGQMLTGKRYTAMKETLAKDLTNTDRIAMSYVNKSTPDVYAVNMNYETYSIEKDSKIDTSFTLYNHDAVEKLIKENPQLLPSPKVDIPKDMRWNQQHINSAITQGILQGKSIPAIAKDLQRVTTMDENSAIRNARTAMTGAQNAGRLDSMKRAAGRGVGLKKGWMSTLDNVTRDSHVDLDGEVQELDRTFSNGLMYPGDGLGAPAEVYNCRCRLTHEYDKYKTDWSNPANRNTEKLGDMSYQEWKDAHKEGATKIRAKQAEKTKQEEATKSKAEETKKVTNRQEAYESLKQSFADVDTKVLKLDEELLVDSVNKFNELNDRFGALGEGSILTTNNSTRSIAYVASRYREEKCELSLSNKFYKNIENYNDSFYRGQKSKFDMPCTKANKNVYVITHEYGHIIERTISRQRTDFDELATKTSMYNPSLKIKEYRSEEKKKANEIKNEIIEIAKSNNPNFELNDNISSYGKTNSYEFFAECFANSQCGAPNELGIAMEQWLVQEGF